MNCECNLYKTNNFNSKLTTSIKEVEYNVEFPAVRVPMTAPVITVVPVMLSAAR